MYRVVPATLITRQAVAREPQFDTAAVVAPKETCPLLTVAAAAEVRLNAPLRVPFVAFQEPALLPCAPVPKSITPAESREMPVSAAPFAAPFVNPITARLPVCIDPEDK